MASTNDITGDKIQTKPSNIDEENWESIFGLSSWQKYMLEKKRIEEEIEQEDKADK